MRFADYLRALRDGTQFAYDQEPPPADGIRPPAEAVIGGERVVRGGAGVRELLLADVDEVAVSELHAEPGADLGGGDASAAALAVRPGGRARGWRGRAGARGARGILDAGAGGRAARAGGVGRRSGALPRHPHAALAARVCAIDGFLAGPAPLASETPAVAPSGRQSHVLLVPVAAAGASKVPPPAAAAVTVGRAATTR